MTRLPLIGLAALVLATSFVGVGAASADDNRSHVEPRTQAKMLRTTTRLRVQQRMLDEQGKKLGNEAGRPGDDVVVAGCGDVNIAPVEQTGVRKPRETVVLTGDIIQVCRKR